MGILALSPNHGTHRLPPARAEVRVHSSWEPWPLSHFLTHILRSQAKPDPRAEPTGVTMPSPQPALLLGSSEALPVWVGPPEHPS